MVTSESAAAPDSVREFVARVPGEVEQLWVDGITQFEWYDRPGPVALAADRAAAHFATTLG